MSKARELAELSRTVADSADAVAITINSDEEVTFASGIDVTGTVTADGLTVEKEGTDHLKIIDTSSSNALTVGIGNTVGSIAVDPTGSVASSKLDFTIDGNNAIRIAEGGDISFYEDTGTTPKMVWSSSDESLNLSSNSAYVVTNSGQAVNGLDIAGAEGSLGSYGGAISLGTGRTGRSAIAAVQGHATDGDANGLAFFTHASSGSTADSIKRMEVAFNGDVSFYDTAGTTPKFFWDASAEYLGIGTSTPTHALNVVVSDNSGIQIESAASQKGYLFFGDDASNTVGRIGYDHASDAMDFWTGSSSRMTLDSTGIDVTGTVTADGLDVNSTTSGAANIQVGNAAADIALGIGSPSTANKVVVTAGGSVGIGTTSPEKPLHVNSGTGNIGVRVESSDATASIEFMDSGTTSTALSPRIGGISDDFFVQTSGSERMRITAAGNIEIKSGGELIANRADNARNIKLFNDNDFGTIQTSNDPIKIDSAVYTRFDTGGSERMRIDAGGSILIGKTTPADLHNTWNHIIIGEKGAIISQNGAGGIDGITLADNAYIDADTGTYAYQTTGAASLIRQSGGVTTFSNAASGSAGAALTPVTRMVLDASGSVGIGTGANIDEMLHVKKSSGTTLVKTEVAAGSVVGYEITKTGTTTANWRIVDGQVVNGQLEIYDVTNSRSILNADSAEVVINDTGADLDFRVESNTLTHAFYIDGASGRIYAGSNVGSYSARLTLHRDSYSLESRSTGTGSEGHIAFQNANGAVGTIFTNGSTTSYNTSSDQRLKENIADADDAGSRVDAIQVRQFDWKVDGSHQDYGMVAQELQVVAPEAVSAPEDPEEMMGVDYSKLVPMMLKEIQSLRARIAALES